MDAEAISRAAEERYARLKSASDVAEAGSDNAAAVIAARAWAEGFPANIAPAHRLSAAYRRAGDLPAALDALQRGVRQNPADLSLLKAATKISALIGDLESAVEWGLACADLEADAEKRETLVQVGRWRLVLADAAGAKLAFEEAIALGEPREKHRPQFAHIAYLQRERAAGLAFLDAEEAENAPTQITQTLRQKLNTVPERTGTPPKRLRSAATAELQAYAAASNTPVGEATPDATRLITEAGDILIERVADSRSLLLAFGGLSTMFGGTAEDMGFLVRTVRINALFVSDPQRLLMLGGFSSIGDYWQTIGWLKDLKQAWSIEHIYCLGLSGGGYPAIRYGLDLDATRVLTFAAPTEISPTITQTDTRATAIAHRILTRRPHMCVNLRDELAKRGKNAPEIINYYGADMPEDSYHGRNIEGLPTVSSRAVTNFGSHGVIRWLKQSGIFREILREFLREASAVADGAPPLRSTWKAG